MKIYLFVCKWHDFLEGPHTKTLLQVEIQLTEVRDFKEMKRQWADK